MKLPWPGFKTNRTVLIQLAPGSFTLAECPVLVQGEYFTVKDELHVTLIGEKVGSLLEQQITRDSETSKVIARVFEDIDWSFEKTGPVHILSRLKKGSRQKSIIMLLDMPGMAIFYEQLSSLGLLPDKTPLPPAHVTLYTHNCSLGIGVPSDDALNTLSIESMSVSAFNKTCKD